MTDRRCNAHQRQARLSELRSRRTIKEEALIARTKETDAAKARARLAKKNQK